VNVDRVRDAAGMSLIELLVATLVILMLLGAVYSSSCC